MVRNRSRERLSSIQVLADVFQRGAERTRAGCALQELDRIRDWNSNLYECRELARKEHQVGGADPEECRKFPVDPTPAALRRAYGHHPEPAIEQVAMNGGGTAARGHLFFQVAARRIGPIRKLADVDPLPSDDVNAAQHFRNGGYPCCDLHPRIGA